jgi:16S rRNA (uracil1498-N3)-methyltransferase
MSAAAKVRLHVAHPVGAGQTVPLDRDQAHYLFVVMRLGPGDRVLVFNQTSGEWLAEVADAGRRGGALRCVEQTRPRREPADVWLLFAPIRKERTAFIVEKATELGAAVIQPVRTAFTNAERVKLDRLRAHAVEATEQCGGTVVPEVRDLEPGAAGPLARGAAAHVLRRGAGGGGGRPCRRGTRPLGDPDRPRGRVLRGRAGAAFGAALRDGAASARASCGGGGGADWPEGRRLMFCDEGLAGASVGLAGAESGPWAILIGPEGGFSEAERARLASLPFATAVSLGPRILRADTAAVAALTLWQALLGDWR